MYEFGLSQQDSFTLKMSGSQENGSAGIFHFTEDLCQTVMWDQRLVVAAR